MDASAGSAPHEAAPLRRHLNDLITALPARSGGEAGQIVNALQDNLLEMLRLAFVLARLNDPDGGPSLEMMRSADSWTDIGDANLSVASAHLGLHGEIGILVAGSERSDFPTEAEQFRLDLAASQAALGLQQARIRNLTTNQLNFQLTVDSIPGMVHTMTAAGAVEFVNQQILTFFGKTLEEINDWGTLVHPDDRARVIDLWTRSVETGEPFDSENRVLRADGTYRWLHTRGLPLRDINGHIVRWYNLLTDIDERKRAEDALRESERESTLIVDSIPGLVALLNATGALEVVNRQLLEYFGQTLEELKQWGTNDTVHPEDLPHVIEVFSGAIATGSPYQILQRFKRSDGVYRWFTNRGYPVRDPDGNVVRWCVLLTDIEERKQAEEALRASERNLQLLTDSIPALAWSARPDGSAEFFSKHYLDFMGLSPERAGGWGWTTAVHPDDLNGLAAIWQRMIASGELGEAEARLRRQDGEYRWFLFRANPLHDEQGNIVKWYGVNTDIEDRKRAEAELKQAHGRLAEAQRLSKTGSFITDMMVGQRAWSEEAYRIFEFPPESEITLDAIRAVVHPEDVPVYDAALRRASEGLEWDLAFRIVTSTGNAKHLRAIGHLMERVAERPVFIGAIQDVTANKIAEEALNRARSELAHVARITTLSTSTASIAHEVNQPLSGIITNASTCLRMLDASPPDIDGARETARRTIRDGNRASDVIARLRALFSKKEFMLEPLDLNEAAREVLALSSSDLQRHKVVLQSDLADDLPAVTGDRIQLQQVILNLLRNASDAMVGVDDRPRHLLIRTGREDGDRVRVTVQDAGVGLDRQSMDKLFDAFYTTKIDGMGIGLSVSRSIVERHQGRLWAEPNDGPGATFSFSIPSAPEEIRSNTKVS